MTSGFTGWTHGSLGRVGPGSRIAGYLIEEQIGAGGMAVVFRARDEVLGRLAAVKLIAPAAADDQEFRARFLRESRMAAAVDSLHIIPVYGAGEAEGLLYIATRFVPGGDLEALLRRSGGVLDPARAGALVAQVASALDAAHAAGLVHRDVKPQNVLVDAVPERAEHAFLSDFGLSKGTGSSTGLTATGQFVGTPDYCAPEQIRGIAVDGRADQYALGCVAFVLLTGKLPFRRTEAMATLYAQVHDPVPSLTGLRSELSPAVNDVIARALAKSPGDRYARCGDFAEALRQALVPSRPAPVPAPQRPPAADGPPPSGARQPPANPTPFPSMLSAPPAEAQPPGLSQWPQAPQSAELLRSSQAAQPAGWPRLARTASGGPAPQASATDPAAGQWSGGPAGTITDGNGGAGTTQGPVTGGHRGQARRGHGRATVIGGIAASVILAAAGITYAAGLSGSSHATGSLSAPSAPKRPGKPVLAATLTAPGGGTVRKVWFSQDGRFLAGTPADGSKIYVWDTTRPYRVITLTVPAVPVSGSAARLQIENIAFSADDTSLTAAATVTNPDGTPLQGSVPNVLYQWNLNDPVSTVIWTTSTSNDLAGNSTGVSFSGDNGSAVLWTSRYGVIRRAALSSEPAIGSPLKLPGNGPIMAESSVDGTGTRLLYVTLGEVDVWDFTKEKVIAALPYKGVPILIPSLNADGTAALETPLAAKTANGGFSPPTLWDVATQSNITPADPRWDKQEIAFPPRFSTDGSIVATVRAGGEIDLWDVATHKYLLTITDPNYRKGIGAAVAGPGGSEVAILGRDGYRQISLWETPLSPPKAGSAAAPGQVPAA